MEHHFSFGKALLEEYHRLDDDVANRGWMTGDNDTANENLKWMIEDINNFITEAAQFINDTDEYVGGKILLLKNRQHDYVNDEEVGSELLRRFYSYGLTVEHIVPKLEEQLSGKKDVRSFDGKFHYALIDRVIYRNKTEMPIHSRGMKREALVELVFERASSDDWITAEDIEERRTEKNEYDENLLNPYTWESKVCDALNKETKEKFDINYDLFERDKSARIRLNPKAK